MSHPLNSSAQEIVNEVFGPGVSTFPPNAPHKAELPLSWHPRTRKQESLENDKKRKRLCRVVSIEAARIDGVRSFKRRA